MDLATYLVIGLFVGVVLAALCCADEYDLVQILLHWRTFVFLAGLVIVVMVIWPVVILIVSAEMIRAGME